MSDVSAGWALSQGYRRRCVRSSSVGGARWSILPGSRGRQFELVWRKSFDRSKSIRSNLGAVDHAMLGFEELCRVWWVSRFSMLTRSVFWGVGFPRTGRSSPYSWPFPCLLNKRDTWLDFSQRTWGERVDYSAVPAWCDSRLSKGEFWANSDHNRFFCASSSSEIIYKSLRFTRIFQLIECFPFVGKLIRSQPRSLCSQVNALIRWKFGNTSYALLQWSSMLACSSIFLHKELATHHRPCTTYL